MGEEPESNSRTKPTRLEPLGSALPPPTTTPYLSKPKSILKTIGDILRNWLLVGAGSQPSTEPRLRLDATPSGEEENRDFSDQNRAMGFDPPYREGAAKTRIDMLARRLAFFWTLFLMYIVMAQGNADGTAIRFFGKTFQVVPKFHLESSEFIAVFTTTTASVFGFLVIVANHLFKRQDNNRS
jgi:hypothetical protein